MLRYADAWDRGFNRVIVRPRLARAVALRLGIEGVQMGRAASQPEEDTRVGFALRQRVGALQGSCGKRSGAGLQYITSSPVCGSHVLSYGTITNSGEFSI